MQMETEVQIENRDLIPVLDLDFAIADAHRVYVERGPLLYMTNPWWEKTNRHLLIHHLTKTYQYCMKNKLPYKDMIRFVNRTAFHLHPTGRVIVREISQTMGSVTFRAHFKNLHTQFKGPRWSELFDLEDRFWAIQKKQIGKQDSYGAIGRVGSKRTYVFWETLNSIVSIAADRGLPFLDLMDYTMGMTKFPNPARLGANLGHAIAQSNIAIHQKLAQIRAQPHFASLLASVPTDKLVTDWRIAIGLQDARLIGGTVPLGFYISHEHIGAGGKMEDVAEVAPNGEYKTRSGAIFQGDFWFKNARNPWLVVQIGSRNASRVDPESWYDPGQYGRVPTVEELMKFDPEGPWTRVWDKATGRSIGAQAGRIVLKLR